MKEILPFCLKYDMLPHNGIVLVCVSGGADSMCLLHMLNAMSPMFGFSLAAAHYNHNLRGAESDKDEIFVKEYCDTMGMPVYVGSGNVLQEAKKLGLGIEETARKLRYSFFFETAETIGASRIATAHNADDNVETILLRLCRGTGLRGLGGIPPVRENIIRPLLQVTRKEIDEYLLANSIPHREDSTNTQDEYTRNKIRHHVMPVLKSINSSLSSIIAVSAELFREDEEYLCSLSDQFIENNLKDGVVSRQALLSLPQPISGRVIRKICGDGLGAAHVAAVLELARNGGASSSLSVPGMTVRCEYAFLRFYGNENETFLPVSLFPGHTTQIPELGLSLRCEKDVLTGEIHKSLTTFLFKYDNICGNIVVRPRIRGDSIKLSTSSGNKSLKKLFIDKKIPVHNRGRVPIIADEQGPLAIPGIGCDVRGFPEKGNDVLKVTVEEIKKL